MHQYEKERFGLRKAIMTAKKDTTGDSLRGIEYQLLNALSVKNTEKFMDIVARLIQFLWIGKTPDTEWDDSDVTGQRKIFGVWIRICFRTDWML